MSGDMSQALHSLNTELELMKTGLEASLEAVCRCRAYCTTLQSEAAHGLEQALTDCTVPITDHRRAHRSGRPAKLDADPELRAFVMARIDRLTFPEFAQAVAEAFPPNRRVSKSTIHKWWQGQRPTTKAG